MVVHGDLKKYGRLEFEFSGNVDYIKIIRPDGVEDSAFPFVYQPTEINYNSEGLENIEKIGQSEMRCRYTPDFTGKAVVNTYYKNKITETTEIEILSSDNHGYVKISDKDEKYFSYSDGTAFLSIGINAAYPTRYSKSDGTEFGLDKSYCYIGLKQYERWFKKLSENGVNVVRVWLGHEYFNPDTQNIHSFDYTQFSKTDKLLELAKKYNIKLKLTLEQFRFFDYEKSAEYENYNDHIYRIFHKRLYCGNRRCENIVEWLTQDVWINGWLAKVKEFAKRYSGDTEVFAIELWNEMNALDYPDEVVNWNKLIMPQVKKLFPHNMVVNSLGSLDSVNNQLSYDRFCWDKSDFVQIHRYLDQGAEYSDCTVNPIEMIKGAFKKIKTKKALYIAETGAVNNCHSGPFKYYVNDDNGIILADTVYTPLFCKSCGTGNIWHWNENYVEAKNLYHLFKPISELTFGINFDKENFESIDMSAGDVSLLLLKGTTVILGYIRNRKYNWENVLRDLQDVSPINEFICNIDGAHDIQCIPIWANDDTKVKINGNSVIFQNIYIGTMFKIYLG